MDIEATIKRILVDELFVTVPQTRISQDDSLHGVIGLDSLGFAELRAQCEDVFGVTIVDDEFVPENFATVRTVTQLVSRLRAAGQDEEAVS